MKNISAILIIIFSISLFSCDNGGSNKLSTDVVENTKSAKTVNADGSAPRFSFDEKEHDFGKLIQGERVSYSFRFINSGGSDLLINKVSTSCGCTVSKYPKEPIAPGKEGAIEVTFNSRSKKGYQNKSISVMANTEPNRSVLRVKATVLLPEKN